MLQKITPKRIFVLFFIVIFVTFIVIDISSLHELWSYGRSWAFERIQNYLSSEVWNVAFLAEYLALFITTITVAIVPRFRRSLCKCLTASIIMFCLVLFGLWQFYYGPRIITEVDGVADVRYSCVVSDVYQAYVGLPHAQLVCALHSIPTPATNLLDRATGGDDVNFGFLATASDLAKFVSFMSYNAVFLSILALIWRFCGLTNGFVKSAHS